MKKNRAEEQFVTATQENHLLVESATHDGATEIPRRDFLKIAGFTIAAATVGACERPDHSTLYPHITLSPEATPGVSVWYTGVCGACTAGCGILVRSRDNRPVKIEGIPGHPLSDGALCAAGQAALLTLYDGMRLTAPLKKRVQTTYAAIDEEITETLQGIRDKRGRVRLLSGTITSPTLQRGIDAFLSTFTDSKHVMYDTVSASALMDVHEEVFGQRLLPRFHFDKARVIVSFDADFLGTWISPVEFSASRQKGRNVDVNVENMSWHVQIEGGMSLTGTNADLRIALREHERFALLRRLTQHVSRLAGVAYTPGLEHGGSVPDSTVEAIAEHLWKHRGTSLVVCGSNEHAMQRETLRLNLLLENYSATIDISAPSRQKKGSDKELYALREELRRGEVDALISIAANPVYDAPDSWEMAELLAAPTLTIRFTSHMDESAETAMYVCPMPHSLEDWSDAEAVSGVFGLSQPAIPPKRTLRPLIDSLAKWSGSETTAYDSIRRYWREELFPKSGAADFETFWRDALLSGSVQLAVPGRTLLPVAQFSEEGGSSATASPEQLELELHARVGLPDSAASSNAWLMELPDAVTKAAWENVAAISAATAAGLKLRNGDIVRIRSLGNESDNVELPILIQEGQADGVLSVAMGYGGIVTERYAKKHADWMFGKPSTGSSGRVGVRGSGLLQHTGAALRNSGIAVAIEATGRRVELAMAQEYQYLAVPGAGGDGKGAQRPCVLEVTADQLSTGRIPSPPHHELHSLWPEHQYNAHHWGMTIDLNACTGCSACVIACQVENNIPVVGKDEVRRNRDMHWLRIDRYYFNDTTGDLRVAHQPMLCHHCDNAPCETVCPVLATVHSEEGLNQQVYNRCVGTRYCSNNCPYKVRRFNWFNYARQEEENLILNPDVTVRSRGVMEKCTFCVQRIQEAKIVAKGEHRQVEDGEIQPACMQSCPTRAIRFGDMNDAASGVSKEIHNPRHYRVLEELGIKPSIGYLMQVRNTVVTGKENQHE